MTSIITGYIGGVYHDDIIIAGQNVSSEPEHHVFKMSKGNPSLFGDNATLLTYVSCDKDSGRYVVCNFKEHVPLLTYEKSLDKDWKKDEEILHDGVEGILGLNK